eukprot:TRINITY_DN19572_c1_g2_i1.p1 TRINITY_DN19572_c1_g2~~TRINITY_DN19572_c1_g2_i1.p1  ORF type:complete len:1389 (+),score=288.69 TRINITY_DN19572_c1_g2_i1:35-4201(+)
MGCLLSTEKTIQMDAEEDPAEAHKKRAERILAMQATVELDVDGDGVADGDGLIVLQRKGGRCEPDGPFLPFCRFDVSLEPKQLFTCDQIYITHVYSERYLTSDGTSLNATAESIDSASIFVLERFEVEDGSVINEGHYVMLRHFESGNYLTCLDDHSPLGLEGRRERGQGNEMQAFEFMKEGRPMYASDRDVFYLQSWLSNFVEVDTGSEEYAVRARRWKRGKNQRFAMRKKAVMEARTTDTARMMQFQCFDLDGNGIASTAEVGFMLNQVGLLDTLGDVMGQAQDGIGLDKEVFKQWADSDAISEDKLQHIEVLGNVAQRLRDSLNEENCLIEVLTTLPSELIADTCAAFEELTGESLKERIIKKTSEQDGYICSNWWRQAMTQLLADPVSLWCQALQDAMDGWGTDEDTLTALVCTIPEELHEDITRMYLDRKGKTLLDHIQSETSSTYKKVLMAQANSLANARCMALHAAMSGMGTDEQQIIRIITSADAGERKEMAEVYDRAYDRSLIEHIESEVSGDFKKTLHAIFTSEESLFDLDADCEALKAAMEGWGTDEEALIKLLASKTHKQMEDIRARFEELHARRLEDWVKSETSGYFQGVLMGLVRDPVKQLAHSIRDCIKGFGTDETGLVTLLSHMPEWKRIAVRKMYSRLFDRDMLKDIKSDTSGDYQKALLACVKLPTRVWAESLMGAMKGFGTSDGLLINFMVLAKDYMDEVRAEFVAAYKTPLHKWIDSECGNADYKRTLMQLAQRNSEDRIDMLPIYWAQRCRDALDDVSTLKDLVSNIPGMVLKRAGAIYQAVYQESVVDSIKKKCKEGRGFSLFTDWWKVSIFRLMETPLNLRVEALNDAMAGIGTDEFSLTACIMTIPENTHQEVQDLYEKTYGKKLVARIESETSFAYKKALRYATLSKVESRCTALHNAMSGMGTDENQLIRIICCATPKERELICMRYEQMYSRNLIANIESETSGHFKNALVAVLESDRTFEPDYEADCNALKEAMDGVGTDEDAILRIVASKSDEQLEQLKAKYEEITGENLFDRVNSETWDGGVGLFVGVDFRNTMLTLLRARPQRLAHCVRYCMAGFGTDDTGLITCLVHLPEKTREELVHTYRREFDRDLFDDIKGETSGDYENALLCCVRSQPQTYAHAMRSAMKGLGTSDNLLINMLCLSKDRMDEVRASFAETFEGQELVAWLDGDCSGDYKDTLIRVAKRECLKFPGVEVGCTAQAPPSGPDAIYRFNKTFNELCRQKRENPDQQLVIPEVAQQELGCAFLFWSAPDKSSCSPNMDMKMVWEMTNAISSAENRFCPADDGEDLKETFREWDIDGSGEIAWNDFVHEMNVRVNDPNHYNAPPLEENAPHYGNSEIAVGSPTKRAKSKMKKKKSMK